jgi:hypothetical protein
VVDEACIVAPDTRITNPAPIDGETPDLSPFEVSGLAFQAFLVIDQLACVLNDAFVLVDRLESEDAPPVKLRTAPGDTWSYELVRHAKTG